MSELTFYTNPMSRGQIVRWALAEVGADYNQVIVEYGPDMKASDYTSINPMGKVPAIVHDGKVVTECAAICVYLAEAYAEQGLAPTDQQRHDYYRWMFFAAGPLESAITNNNLGFHTDEEQQRTAGYGTYDLAVNTLANHFDDNDYVCGDSFTMADVYVGSQIDWGLMFKTIPDKPGFVAYAERLRAREAYQRAKAIDNALIAEMS